MLSLESVPSSQTPSPLRAFLAGGPSPPDIFADLATQLERFGAPRRIPKQDPPSPTFFPDSMELADLILDEGVMLRRRDPESLQDGESPFVKRDLHSPEKETAAAKLHGAGLGRQLRSREVGTLSMKVELSPTKPNVKVELSPTKPRTRDLNIEQDKGAANRRNLRRLKAENSPFKPTTPMRFTELIPPRRPIRGNPVASIPLAQPSSPTMNPIDMPSNLLGSGDQASYPTSPLVETQPVDPVQDITDTEESDVEGSNPLAPLTEPQPVNPVEDITDTEESDVENPNPVIPLVAMPPPVPIDDGHEHAPRMVPCICGCDGSGMRAMARRHVSPRLGIAMGDVPAVGLQIANVGNQDAVGREGNEDDPVEAEDGGAQNADANTPPDQEDKANAFADEEKPTVKREVADTLKRKSDDGPDPDTVSNNSVKKSKGSALSIELKASSIRRERKKERLKGKKRRNIDPLYVPLSRSCVYEWGFDVEDEDEDGEAGEEREEDVVEEDEEEEDEDEDEEDEEDKEDKEEEDEDEEEEEEEWGDEGEENHDEEDGQHCRQNVAIKEYDPAALPMHTETGNTVEGYPHYKLTKPKRMLTLPLALRRKVWAHLATVIERDINTIRAAYPLDYDVTMYGRVVKLELDEDGVDEGDVMRGADMLRRQEDTRDATYIRYDCEVDRAANRRRHGEDMQMRTFFGQLKCVLVIDLPAAPALDREMTTSPNGKFVHIGNSVIFPNNHSVACPTTTTTTTSTTSEPTPYTPPNDVFNCKEDE
ncbi:hypothetical protein CVT24_013158 [Panaeolus cyanescens]|uniref:Uncharacterized protein n=1 Tax=Panaeolus cyanescens TaxID=181874 RepID=A0A409WA31_9AGAR|nr:hypothetical protein CVT24_013158 [Panaeolus cyanescens]